MSAQSLLWVAQRAIRLNLASRKAVFLGVTLFLVMLLPCAIETWRALHMSPNEYAAEALPRVRALAMVFGDAWLARIQEWPPLLATTLATTSVLIPFFAALLGSGAIAGERGLVAGEFTPRRPWLSFLGRAVGVYASGALWLSACWCLVAGVVGVAGLAPAASVVTHGLHALLATVCLCWTYSALALAVGAFASRASFALLATLCAMALLWTIGARLQPSAWSDWMVPNLNRADLLWGHSETALKAVGRLLSWQFGVLAASGLLFARGSRLRSSRVQTSTSALEVRGLGKAYWQKQVFGDLSFRVDRGRTFGIAGANGSGKTTLLALLAGREKPSRGSLCLGSPAEARSELAVGATIDRGLLATSDSVEQALTYLARVRGIDEPERAATAALHSVEAERTRQTSCRRLSDGERRRVLLAQALLGDPRLLLLDEPTAGLDPRATHAFLQLVERVRGTKTLIIATHDPAVSALCDEMVLLGDGKLTAHETNRRQVPSFWSLPSFGSVSSNPQIRLLSAIQGEAQ